MCLSLWLSYCTRSDISVIWRPLYVFCHTTAPERALCSPAIIHNSREKWYGILQVNSGLNSESPTDISNRNWLASLSLRINSYLTAGFLDQGSLLSVILDRFLLSYRVFIRAILYLSLKSTIAAIKFRLEYANRPMARSYACHADEQGFPKVPIQAKVTVKLVGTLYCLM